MRSSSPETSIANNCSHGAITREEEAEFTEDDFAQVKGLTERFSSVPPVAIDFEKGTCLEQRIITACKLRLPDVDPKIFTVREHKEPGAVIASWKCFVCDHSFKKKNSYASRITHTTTKTHLRKLARFLGVACKCFLDDSAPGHANETVACPILGCVEERFHNTDELKAHYKSIHSSPLSDVKMAGHDGQNGLLGTNMERGDEQEDLAGTASTPNIDTAGANAGISARPYIGHSEDLLSYATIEQSTSLDTFVRQAETHYVQNIQLQSQVQPPLASSFLGSQTHFDASFMLPQGQISPSYPPLTSMPLPYASPPTTASASFCHTGIPFNMNHMPNCDFMGLDLNGTHCSAYQPGIDGLQPGPSRLFARADTLVVSTTRTESLMSITSVRPTAFLRTGY